MGTPAGEGLWIGQNSRLRKTGVHMTSHTTQPAKRGQQRPQKPRPDFPLYAHATGRWAKKVRGHVHYFTRWADDPKGVTALEEWLDVKDDLLAGRVPRNEADALTVVELCNRYLTFKEHLRDNSEITWRTFRDLYDACTGVVETFGKGRAVTNLAPDDFGQLRVKLSGTRGPAALRNEMQRVRSIFKFAFDEGLILAPVRFGQSFAKPRLDAVRRAREENRRKNGKRMFEACEILQLLKAATPQFRAMVLLGVNCGFGNSDLSNLPLSMVNLDTGWIDYPRPKTSISRRCPLWPETVAALQEWLPEKTKPQDSENTNCVFLTRAGTKWVKVNKNGAPADALGQQFSKLLKRLDLYRPGLSFYALRHTFETVAGDSKDQVATSCIMGHVDASMSAHYRERIGDDRLVAVVNHVRGWLFGSGETK